jgi:hypothetical protein
VVSLCSLSCIIPQKYHKHGVSGALKSHLYPHHSDGFSIVGISSGADLVSTRVDADGKRAVGTAMGLSAVDRVVWALAGLGWAECDDLGPRGCAGGPLV